ncbi:hypothetical protein OG897_08475 [Streptomyces sp. NBC_00237]|uniref:hypothetical protein n=1 Tax=Streptomyces sp. NBC_00237 TaxID=2975687 RepID=UPI002256787E|nr:hypothetical protein [Streptomyces sp. NBC_00237]MCX5201486.1 hypothetical protein [Streptomyces sp. NBC_00237]
MTEPAKKTSAKKAKAQKAEALDESISFEYNGNSYTFGHFRTWPLKALQSDDEVEVTRLILGEDQWATFEATDPSIGDFFDFAEAMSEARGEAGDSGN